MENTEDRVEPEVRRLADLLAMVVRVSGRSRRSIEAELGLGSSGLSKILNGTVRLQMSHILSILEAVEVDPNEFFQVAYPRRRARKSPLMEEIRLLVEQRPQEAESQDTEKDLADDELPDFDERVRLVLLRLLRDTPQGAN